MHHLSAQTKTATEIKMAKLDHVVIVQPFVFGIIIGSRSVMGILYTFSCSIPHML